MMRFVVKKVEKTATTAPADNVLPWKETKPQCA